MQQYEIEFYGSGIDVMASAITNEQDYYLNKTKMAKDYTKYNVVSVGSNLNKRLYKINSTIGAVLKFK